MLDNILRVLGKVLLIVILVFIVLPLSIHLAWGVMMDIVVPFAQEVLK